MIVSPKSSEQRPFLRPSRWPCWPACRARFPSSWPRRQMATGWQARSVAGVLMLSKFLPLKSRSYSFGQAKLGPIKHRGAKIDHRGIQAEQRILESELPLLPRSWLAGRQDLALRQQLLKDRLLQLPRPMFVGIGQRGASRSGGQTQMPKFSFTRGQASADFTQGLGVPQLTKEHRDELAPTTETAGMPLGLVLAHGRFKL